MNKTSKSSDPQKAYNYAIRLLTAREYGYGELVGKLCRKYEEDVSYLVAEHCRERGFQSDERAAEMISRHTVARLAGPRYAYHEAQKRGLEVYLLNSYLEEIDFSEIALQFLERKYGDEADFSPCGRQKMLAALYRRGFDGSTCLEALKQFSDNAPE